MSYEIKKTSIHYGKTMMFCLCPYCNQVNAYELLVKKMLKNTNIECSYCKSLFGIKNTKNTKDI